jgi:hypothetical protein
MLGGIFGSFTGGAGMSGSSSPTMVNSTAGKVSLDKLKAAEGANPGTMYMMTGDQYDKDGYSLFNPATGQGGDGIGSRPAGFGPGGAMNAVRQRAMDSQKMLEND